MRTRVRTSSSINTAVMRLDAWLETMRGPNGYGGPVAHWWQQSLMYTGAGLDWRYEGIIEGYLQLWARTEKTIAFVTHSIPEAVYLSTKIVVMSPRPGRITDVIESTLPRERPLDIRDSPEFIEIAHRVREGLRAGHGDDV